MPHSVKGFLEINKGQIKFFVLQCEVLLYYQSERENLFDSASTWSEAGLFDSISFFIRLLIISRMILLEWQMRLIVIGDFAFSCIPFSGMVATRDFVHSVGNSPVAQIVLQILCIIYTTASLPPLINSPSMPSIPGAFRDLILEMAVLIS